VIKPLLNCGFDFNMRQYSQGLDYVSCSPFRVPVARLAAAQAALICEREDKANTAASEQKAMPR
jgi:hypothetical protein